MSSVLAKKRRWQKRQLLDFYFDEPPPATEPKALFEAARHLTSQQCFVPNLGRAVFQNVQTCQAPQPSEDIGALSDFARVWGDDLWLHVTTPEPPRHDDRKLRRHLFLALKTAIREAEENGTIHHLADNLARALYVPAESATIQSADKLLARACRLERRGRTGAALDIVYDQFDEMLLAGKFAEVDQRLAKIDASQYSVDLLLAILTITLAAKSRLPSRAAFFAQVDKTLRQRGDWEEGLLVGLE